MVIVSFMSLNFSSIAEGFGPAATALGVALGAALGAALGMPVEEAFAAPSPAPAAGK